MICLIIRLNVLIFMNINFLLFCGVQSYARINLSDNVYEKITLTPLIIFILRSG